MSLVNAIFLDDCCDQRQVTTQAQHIIQHISLSEVLIQKVAKTCLVIKFNQVISCYIRPRDNFPQPSLTPDATVPYLAGMNCPWHLTAIL